MNCNAAGLLLVQIGRNQILDARLRALALDHARGCRHCGLRLANERMLSAGLGMLASEQGNLEPPPEIERALMDAYRRRFTVGRRFRTYWPAAAAIAAGLAFAAVQIGRLPIAGTASMQPGMQFLTPELAANEPANQGSFLPVPFSDPIAPYERTEVQRAALTRDTLLAMGIASGAVAASEGDDEELFNVEIVVGEDGAPRAVRMLY